MLPTTIVISINASWNLVNFRTGLIRALQARGYRVVAVAPLDAYSARLTQLDIPYEPIAIDTRGISPWHDLTLLVRYWRLLRRLRPALFLGYTIKPNVFGTLAATALGARVINNVSGLGTAFIRRNLLTLIASMLYRIAFRRSSTVFFQNEEDRDLFVAMRLVSGAQTEVLPGSGVDLERFRPLPRPVGPISFLLIGRLLWDKGVGEFVAAARAIRARHPQVRFQLLGFLEVSNRTAIRRATVEAWVAEGVIDYLGASDDVRPHIAAADCVVLPSYREGLPRSLLEAAAMAKPIVATDVPGCRHVVEDGVNGFLCAARDAGSLETAMERVIALDEAGRAALGSAGRAMVERRFDERITIDRYLKAIDRALAENARG